jgi:hypothetical protein
MMRDDAMEIGFYPLLSSVLPREPCRGSSCDPRAGRSGTEDAKRKRRISTAAAIAILAHD